MQNEASMFAKLTRIGPEVSIFRHGTLLIWSHSNPYTWPKSEILVNFSNILGLTRTSLSETKTLAVAAVKNLDSASEMNLFVSGVLLANTSQNIRQIVARHAKNWTFMWACFKGAVRIPKGIDYRRRKKWAAIRLSTAFAYRKRRPLDFPECWQSDFPMNKWTQSCCVRSLGTSSVPGSIWLGTSSPVSEMCSAI